MIIVPTNIANVTQAVFEMLRDAPDVGGKGVMVSRSEEPNETPTLHGWVGVYRDRIDYPTRTLGLGGGYRNQLIRLFLLVQATDASSGSECEDRLEELLQKVIGVLLSDPTLKGTVDTLDEFSVIHQSYEKSGGMYMQKARIDFTGVIPVSAT